MCDGGYRLMKLKTWTIASEIRRKKQALVFNHFIESVVTERTGQ